MSRRAEITVTMKPARKSSSTIRISKKKVEVAKAGKSRNSTRQMMKRIINHTLSMILFIICLVEFLLFPAFATSTFFLLILMVLLDFLAGFIVTVISARRDIDFSPAN